MSANRVEWINRNGKDILVVDYSELKGKELLDVFNEGKVCMIEKGSDVLAIAIFTGAKIGGDYLSEAKKEGVKLDKMMKRTAIIGMSGLHKIFFNSLMRLTGQGYKTKLFDSIDQSLDWLTTD